MSHQLSSPSTEVEPEAELSPSSAAQAAATVLPPQLETPLGDAAARVSEFVELLPGMPWTKSLMEDLYGQLRNNGRFDANLASVPGFARIHIELQRHIEMKRGEIGHVRVEINCYRGVDDFPPDSPTFELGYTCDIERFPDTEKGIMTAFEFAKARVQYLSKRGFCASCLQQEPPKKRIRLMNTGVCAECLLQRAIE